MYEDKANTANTVVVWHEDAEGDMVRTGISHRTDVRGVFIKMALSKTSLTVELMSVSYVSKNPELNRRMPCFSTFQPEA